jgi:hypothetical protein
LTLYPFLELEAGSVPFGPNFRNLTFGEPSSGFTPGPRSASPFYSPSSYHLPGPIILFLLKKLVGTSILKISIENYAWGKKKPPMIRVRLLKRRRREVKVDPKLVANGMFQAWWPMECSKLGGQWNVKEKHIFTFSPFPTFPPTILFKPSFFPFDLKVLLYHGFKPLLMHFFIFL